MDTTDALLLSEARTKARSGEAKRLRERRNLPRGAAAEVVAVHWATLYRWEEGLRRPSGAAGIRYGRFLRVLEHS